MSVLPRGVALMLLALNVLTACGTGDGGTRCRNGQVLADVEIEYFPAQVGAIPAEQLAFIGDRLVPGFEPLAGTVEYDVASLVPDKPYSYLYFDAPLTRSQERKLEEKLEDRDFVRAVRFDVEPRGGFVPSSC